MKLTILYCFFGLIAPAAHAQYLFRGSIKDEKNVAVANAVIRLQSSGQQVSSGADGLFKINASAQRDTLTIIAAGYEQLKSAVQANVFCPVILKLTAEIINKNRQKLISLTKDENKRQRFSPFVSDETYFKLIENEFVATSSFPNTGFSLNVNKASYSNVRRFINMQSLVPPDAVRIEELINYFNLGYNPPADSTAAFRISSYVTPCPWNDQNQLLHLNVSARKLDISKKPPGNFVFLIDVSGSMDMPNRLPLLKAAFQLFAKNLRPEDRISIVIYGGSVGVWLSPTPGNESEKINRAIELLTAAGDTPGASAIDAAYKLATESFIPGGNNRVILATDGDFNVGPFTEKALGELITKKRESGVYLTCLGVGMGNFKDSKLQTLAKKGNGNYAYLDDLQEAEKVLVYELTETLYAVAEDAFINISFNPKNVSRYRLVGFDNKKEAVQDGSSELDGGEIGSGSTTAAIFEITPARPATTGEGQSDLATLSFKYRRCGDIGGGSQEIQYAIPRALQTSDSLVRHLNFAAAVAMYGMKLKNSPYLNNRSWKDIRSFAAQYADKSNYLQNDFLLMIDKTISIYDPPKKKLFNLKKKERIDE